MQALLNRDEVVLELAKIMLAQQLKRCDLAWPITDSYLEKANKRFEKTKLISIDFNIVNDSIRQDLQNSKDKVIAEYKSKYRLLVNWLSNNFDRLDLDEQYLIDLCVNSTEPSFVKTVGKQLDAEVEYIVSSANVDPEQPVLLRNIVNNEKLLAERFINKQPFWFIDSGYTNFINGKKIWHRLVKDHIHIDVTGQSYPADRLHLIGGFPRPWRTGGSKILVVESSQYHYDLFGKQLPHWRNRIEHELNELTDRPVEFRGKDTNRKTRDNLYERLLSDNDIYCVITDASAAAIEAIWAGIPVITLNKHITSAVARTNLRDINNLYRGDIGNWLCAVSYNQFTKKELFDGTALRIMQEHGNV